MPEGQGTLWWLCFPSSHRKGQSPSSVAEQPLSYHMGDTAGVGWPRVGLGQAWDSRVLEQHGPIQEKMLPVDQNCDFGG